MCFSVRLCKPRSETEKKINFSLRANFLVFANILLSSRPPAAHLLTHACCFSLLLPLLLLLLSRSHSKLQPQGRRRRRREGGESGTVMCCHLSVSLFFRSRRRCSFLALSSLLLFHRRRKQQQISIEHFSLLKKVSSCHAIPSHPHGMGCDNSHAYIQIHQFRQRTLTHLTRTFDLRRSNVRAGAM